MHIYVRGVYTYMKFICVHVYGMYMNVHTCD